MKRKIAILFPGELGSALARILAQEGHELLTTLGGRSERTRELALSAGIRVLPGFPELAATADAAISLVPAASALGVARQYASWAPPGRIFVDANSISPLTAARARKIVTARGIRFVDAAIHGLADRLESQGTLYLSGDDSPEVAALFGARLRVRLLEGDADRASAFKMLMGGMSKGLVALFLEMAGTAQTLGLLEETLEEYARYYPGLMTAIDRLVPSYPRHAGRRTQEMREVERMLRASGAIPRMVRGARFNLAEVATLALEPTADGAPWTARSVVEAAAHSRKRLPPQ